MSGEIEDRLRLAKAGECYREKPFLASRAVATASFGEIEDDARGGSKKLISQVRRKFNASGQAIKFEGEVIGSKVISHRVSPFKKLFTPP